MCSRTSNRFAETGQIFILQREEERNMLYIGNHTTSSKGYAAMARQIIANGGNTFAFFTRNPRGGKAKNIDPEDVER